MILYKREPQPAKRSFFNETTRKNSCCIHVCSISEIYTKLKDYRLKQTSNKGLVIKYGGGAMEIEGWVMNFLSQIGVGHENFKDILGDI